jgi:phage regulator Rha-like protein
MENNKEIIHESEVKELIIELRGEKVLIDRDVAKLYGVETRDINKAVKNNADKFPENYCFSLQLSEKQELVENFHRLESLKYSTVVPKAFTERGLYMLATILKGPRATATTFAIIESFFKLRTLVRNVNIMATEYDEEKRKSLVQRSGELLNELLTDEGDITETESSIELNLYALKMKRTVKRTKKDKFSHSAP